jgi:Flp pilus assembly protein TadD
MKSVPEFRLATQLNPDDGLAHCALGTALLRGSEMAEGESELRRAQELSVCEAAGQRR